MTKEQLVLTFLLFSLLNSSPAFLVTVVGVITSNLKLKITIITKMIKRNQREFAVGG